MIVYLLVVEYGLVLLLQLGTDLMLTGCQVEADGGGGWQPQVAQVQLLVAVDGHLVTAGHLLTHIQHQGIFAGLLQLYLGLEEVPFAYLLLAAFGRGDIHHLALTATSCL